MKLFIFIFLYPLIVFSQVTERSFEALVRNDRQKPRIEEVILTDLVSSIGFEGQYFKIVRGKSNDAIRFDDERELVFRAATVYYHLTIARNYFVNKLKSSFVMNLPQLVIRIDHTNQFSELGHFANDNLDPQYNNALTIPAGQGLSSRGVKPWGIEIWFRPSKKIHLRDVQVNNTETKDFLVLMGQFRNQIYMQTLQRFISTGVVALINPNVNNPLTIDNVVRTVGSSVILEAGYQFIEPLSKAFSRKWYWLDTALVPEIIYHEYAHAALSDHLFLSHSTPIIEGMADFFAGQIADSPKLAMHIKKYNTFNGKNAKRKKDYQIEFEMKEYANTDFVFGLLWEIKSILGEAKGEDVVFKLREKVNTNSTIRNGLMEGLIQTCEEYCESPFTDKLRILKSFNKQGI